MLSGPEPTGAYGDNSLSSSMEGEHLVNRRITFKISYRSYRLRYYIYKKSQHRTHYLKRILNVASLLDGDSIGHSVPSQSRPIDEFSSSATYSSVSQQLFRVVVSFLHICCVDIYIYFNDSLVRNTLVQSNNWSYKILPRVGFTPSKKKSKACSGTDYKYIVHIRLFLSNGWHLFRAFANPSPPVVFPGPLYPSVREAFVYSNQSV